MRDRKYRSKEDEELIELIAADHERGLTKLYQRYKGEFMNVARRFGGDVDIHTDSYHDAVLAFFEILTAGRYDERKASVKTLLFTIGKYKVLSRLRQAGREPLWADLEHVADIVEPGGEKNSPQILLARKALGSLGNKCRRIIELFYYRRLSIREIVVAMGYKNENVVKAHKSRCMKDLREKVRVLREVKN